MITDLIIERRDGKDYDAVFFYDEVKRECEFFSHTDLTADTMGTWYHYYLSNILDAIDKGDEASVKLAINYYIQLTVLNGNLCDGLRHYINTVDWKKPKQSWHPITTANYNYNRERHIS